jgi:aminoglycoside phosphotransferase (APT) family kinase protein
MSLPGLDLAKLRNRLGDGPLSAELIKGGRSNLTYVVTDGASSWVVRRPPLGHVLPTAHDMAREYRVITALRGTGVPVSGTLFLCEDTEVLGASFYVMEYMAGIPYRSREELGALGPVFERQLAERDDEWSMPPVMEGLKAQRTTKRQPPPATRQHRACWAASNPYGATM